MSVFETIWSGYKLSSRLMLRVMGLIPPEGFDGSCSRCPCQVPASRADAVPAELTSLSHFFLEMRCF